MRFNLRTKLSEWRRVLQVARKPARDELLDSSKICVMGIILIGIIGFAMFLLFAFLGV
jgi:protein translocase SEC61 complex gamma subunit